MLARIYRPAKTAMQSGRALTHKWVLEFEAQSAPEIEPLMGWTASSDMLQQVRLEFDTREEAVAYAEKHGIAYQVFEAHPSKARARAYSDNFRYDRKEPWTH